MRLAATVAAVMIAASPAAGRQSPVDNLFVLEGNPRQEATTSPLTLTFAQSAITVPASDVDQALTIAARGIAEGNMSRLFVLKVVSRNVQQTTASPWHFTLASGATVTVPPAAVNDRVTILLRDQVLSGAVAGAPTGATGPQSSAAAKCVAEWPDDFRMRAYCQERQREAAAALAGRSMTSADERTIRSKCERDWPDDFRMRNYCEEQQLKALRSIR